MHVSGAFPVWIGEHKPSLAAAEKDVFEIDIPGYDLRRLILARDPLCAANAFDIYIRTVLATSLGVRMCPQCPHCAESALPCQDAFGSSAEIMGGLAGRGDAIFGAVECQKVTGSLHLHLWFFGQRLHQYHSLQEIAELLEKSLAHADELKDFISNICCTSYPDIEQHEAEMPHLEKQWPKFTEADEQSNRNRSNDEYGQTITDTEKVNPPDLGTDIHWGSLGLGRIPQFIREDRGETYGTALNLADVKALEKDAGEYKQQFDKALQFFQSRSQHP